MTADTREIRQFINELVKLLVVLLPYVALSLAAACFIRPDLWGLPWLVLAGSVAVNGLLPRPARAVGFALVALVLAILASALWGELAALVVVAAWAVRMLAAIWKR